MRRRKSPINQSIAQTAGTSKKIPDASKIDMKVINHPDFTTPVQLINNPNAEVINRRSMIKDIPFYPDLTYRPAPKPVQIPTLERPENIDIIPECNIDFKENLHFKKK